MIRIGAEIAEMLADVSRKWIKRGRWLLCSFAGGPFVALTELMPACGQNDNQATADIGK